MTPQALTPAQVADWLQIDPQTVRRKVRAGEWPALVIGPQTIRFTQEHIARICELTAAKPPATKTARRQQRQRVARLLAS